MQVDRRGVLKFLLLPPLAAAGVVSLSACSHAPLAVAAHPWVGYETLFIARSLTWLPDNVSLHETASATDSLAALGAGKVDAACLTLDEVLQGRANGIDLVIVAVLNISAGADVVMVRDKIASFPALAGQRIAAEESAVGALMLAKLLEAANLSRSDVRIRNLPVNEHLAAWKRGEVDAVVTYEPVASQLAAAGAVRLFDSRQLPETIFDVLAVRRDRLADRGEAVSALLTAHFRSINHLRNNRQDAVYRIASRQNVSPDDVMKALGGVTLPDLNRSRALLAPDSSLHRIASELEALMVEKKMLPRADGRRGLFDDSRLPRSVES
jgi:NitT/TauT family transport system substrate-binding protein